jgi:hypothetical protein
MPELGLLDRLGRLVVRRRWLVAALSIALTGLVLVIAAGALNVLSLSRIANPAAESDQARQVLASRFDTGPPNLAFLVSADDGIVDDPHTSPGSATGSPCSPAGRTRCSGRSVPKRAPTSCARR